MGISEVAKLGVELVQQFDAGVDSATSQQNEEYNSLKAEPEYGALVIHAAVARKSPIDRIEALVSFLGVDLEWAAASLPSKYSQEYSSSVPAFRKQYQKIMAEQTRTMTFDLMKECPLGYANLFEIFRTTARSDCENMWAQALRVVGMYDLEPFKVMSVWLTFLNEKSYIFFVKWSSTTIWKGHEDWVASIKLSKPANPAKSFAFLVSHEIVSSDTVWSMYTANTHMKFTQFEQKWRDDHSSGPQRLNALAMAMPLIDDDDDDEEDVMEDDLMQDDARTSNGENLSSDSVNDSNQTSVSSSFAAGDISLKKQVEDHDADPENFEAVEFLRRFVGYLASSLAVLSNPALEKIIVQLANKYVIAISTSKEASVGFSRLLDARIKEQEQNNAVDSSSLDMYWRPISNAILEPAWSRVSGVLNSIEDREVRFETFRKYMSPSIDLHPSSQSTSLKFSTRERYMLYTDLATRLATTNEMVKARFTDTERNTKDILKRSTKKDAQSLIVPQLLEQFSKCAWPSLNVFVNQVESYNIGTLVANAAAAKSHSGGSSSGFAPLAMDMSPLVLMQQFTVGRNATQKDGLHMSRWLRLLAQFAGDVANGHRYFDFVAIIKSILHQIASNNLSEIFVMDQIVRKLSGVPLQSNLSSVQSLALNSAPLISNIVQKKISEQPNPQVDRLSQKLRQDEDGDLVTMIVSALSYAYNVSSSESDAKVMAAKQDSITNLMSIFRHFNLDAKLDRAHITPKFAANIRIASEEETPTTFDSLQLYDVALDQKVYTAAQSLVDDKSMDRALLSHKFRVKSIKQKSTSAPLPDSNKLLSRILLSPTDALFTSRYLQLISSAKEGLTLLNRGTVLAVSNGGTPSETESFAVFVVDFLTAIYTPQVEVATEATEIKKVLSVFTDAILEAAVPDAPFTVLSNVFNLSQRTLLVYPSTAQDGERIVRRIQLLTTTTEGDLETAVKSLNPQLSQRQKYWCAEEVSPEFLAQLQIHNDRLHARLAAGLRNFN